MAKKGGRYATIASTAAPLARDYNALVDYIIKEEGFLNEPTDIGDGKVTLGSGLTDPKWHKSYQEKGNKWSAEDNRKAVEEEVKSREKWLEDTFPNWGLLPRKAQEALIAYKYNYNFTPQNSPNMYAAATKKDFVGLGHQINATSKDPKFKKGLEDRRKRDQEYYFSGFPSPVNTSTLPTPNYKHVEQPDATRVSRLEFQPSYEFKHQPMHPIQKNFWTEWGRMPYKAEGGEINTIKTWNDLSIPEKAEMMRVAIANGITTLPEIRQAYNQFAEGGNLFGDGSYMSKAKSLIRNNEGWRTTPYKDAPEGKSWRSVGYGFNDSGFRDKYPEGISKHYEKGITKAQAEKELDYYLGKAEKTLKGIYGKQWDSFNDNQKAAILDTYYQRPASVGKGSSFYNAVKAGKDGTNYLGVSGYGKRNKGRREMFSGMKDIPVTMEVPEEVVITPMMPEEIPFTPWNPQALANEQPLVTYTPPTLEAPEPLVDIANAYTQEALEKEQRQRNLNTLGFVLGMTSPQGSDNSLASTISMLTGSGFAKGGKIHIKPSHRGRLTELKKRTNKSEAELYKTGGPTVRKMITFARNARKWKHGLGGPLFFEDL